MPFERYDFLIDFYSRPKRIFNANCKFLSILTFFCDFPLRPHGVIVTKNCKTFYRNRAVKAPCFMDVGSCQGGIFISQITPVIEALSINVFKDTSVIGIYILFGYDIIAQSADKNFWLVRQ